MNIHESELQREQREETQEINRQIDEANFKAVAVTETGRKFMRDLLAQCGVYRTTFTGDAQTTAFNEGARSIGLWLLDKFNDCPDLYLKLLTEKHDPNNRNA